MECPLRLVGVGQLQAVGMCGKLDWLFEFLLVECYNHEKTLCKEVIGSVCTSLLQVRLIFHLPVSG